MKTIQDMRKVSSHAPVRGHRDKCLKFCRREVVSSHAPVRGHPVEVSAAELIHRCFKSCPREGASSI